MSTMYEALRKAEAERKQAAGFMNSGTVKEDTGMAQNRGMSDNTKTILLLIAVICVFGIGIWRFNAAKSAAAPKGLIVHPIAAKPTQVLGPVSDKAVRAPGTYGVDGIIDAGMASMAVINGRLLKVEDKIDHLVVKVITAHSVELLNTKDNMTMTLKF